LRATENQRYTLKTPTAEAAVMPKGIRNRRGELKNVRPIGAFPNQHFNAVTSWSVDAKGQISHAYRISL
jgi:hypothetical protein